MYTSPSAPTESDLEKQPLTSVEEWDIAVPMSSPIESNTITQPQKEHDQHLSNVMYYTSFEAIANNVKFNIEECHRIIEKIKDAYKQVYEHTSETAQRNRSILSTQTTKLDEHLHYIRHAIATIEPSKPTLSNLDLRNQIYKPLLRSYKDVLERYINITLESQRYTSVLLEKYIKSVNTQATSFDLERAMSSEGDEPSVFVQVLMQRGVRRNDQQIQDIMHTVQDIQKDLKHLSILLFKLSEMRSQVNIIIERYRRRWPVILTEGEKMYVIDDNLNLLQQAKVGTDIDFDLLLRKRENRNKVIASLITLATVILVVAIVVSTTIFSGF